MGNKQSSARGGTGDGGVKKRDKKDSKKKERPISTPGYVDEDSRRTSTLNQIRRAGSVDMGSIQQNAEVTFFPDRVVGTSDLAGESVFNLYKRNLHQVLSNWPHLTPLREIDPKKIKPGVLDALQRLYESLCLKQNQVDALNKEKKNLSEFVSGLQLRCDRQIDELRKKDNEISDLDHNVGILEGELRKRGIAPKVHVEEPRGDYDQEPEFHVREEEVRRSIKKHHGARMPTPFLQAGGQRGQDAAIKRSNSMLTDSRRTGGDASKSPETSALLEELNLKVRSLQFALDQKQKENNDLRERIDGGFDPSSSLKKLAPTSGPNITSLVDCYEDLEGRAITKVTNSLLGVLGNKSEGDVHQFLCFSMETSFLQASGLMKSFLDTVHSLLINPLNPAVPTMAEAEASSRRISQSHIGKHIFEKGPDLHAMSRLARRTRLTTELPQYLEEEVASFIRVTSDSTNIEVLIEEVQDVLRRKFPSYATEAVLNGVIFGDFLNACCRLSWQLCSMSPPFYVTNDTTRTRYDEYYHDVLPTQKTSNISIGAGIDYYVWPMLLRKKNGEVLFKARVALTHGLKL